MAAPASHSQIRRDGAGNHQTGRNRTDPPPERDESHREHSETLRCAALRPRYGQQWALGVPSQGTTH
eukprot:2956675-Pleurochrysis_carterae.AAC.1